MARPVVLPSVHHSDKPEVVAKLAPDNISIRMAAGADDPNRNLCGFKNAEGANCDVVSKTNCDNARHEFTHFDGELKQYLPFECRLGCGKRFAQASHRNTHENIAKHGGTRKYVCDCGYAVNDDASLSRHIRQLEKKGDHGHGKKDRKPRRKAGSPAEQAAVGGPSLGQGAMAAAPPVPAVDFAQGLPTPSLEPVLAAGSVPAFAWASELQVPPDVNGQAFDLRALYYEALEQVAAAAGVQTAAPHSHGMAEPNGGMTPDPSSAQETMSQAPPVNHPLDWVHGTNKGIYGSMVEEDQDMSEGTQYAFQLDEPMLDG